VSAPGPDTLLDQRFRLLEALGRGAMGVVYRAHDQSTGRDVAVKLILGEANPERRARLLREGAATAALRHPGIVTVHSVGDSPYGPYLVYELVPGARPMDDLLPSLPPEQRLDLLQQVVAAMTHAHDAGVVHRDLKPANVLVDRDGRAKVVDFGLGWIAQGAQTITQQGALIGSPSHMAPEQISGTATRGAALDVWALGVVLYECLTAELPFAAESLVELSSRICSGRYQPMRELTPDVSPALEAVCARCLQVDPGKRYPSARELQDGLDAALDEAGGARGRVGLAAAVVIGLLAGAGGLAALSAPGTTGAEAPIPSGGEAAAPTPEAPPEPSVGDGPEAKAQRALEREPPSEDLGTLRVRVEEAFAAARLASGRRPEGWLDKVGEAAEGWTLDGDAPALSIEVVLHVGAPDGPVVARALANGPRPDVNEEAQVEGDHGYRLEIPPEHRGKPVFVRALNARGTWGQDQVLPRSGRQEAGVVTPPAEPQWVALREACDALLAHAPDDVRVLALRGLARTRTGMPGSGRSDLTRSLQLDPTHFEALRYAGMRLFFEGEESRGRGVWGEAYKSYLTQKQALVAAKDWAALDALCARMAQTLETTSGYPYLWLHWALARHRLGRSEEALADVDYHLTLVTIEVPIDHAETSANNRGTAYLLRGKIHERLKDWEALEEDAEQVLKHAEDPTRRSSGHYLRSLARLAQNRPLQARKDVEEALDLLPESAVGLRQEMLRLKGRVLLGQAAVLLRQKAWKVLLRRAGQALEVLAPEDRIQRCQALQYRSLAYEGLGRLGKARAELEAAIALLDPGETGREALEARLRALEAASGQ
jgi:tetratricopeptide (TPR) repeat protein